MHTARAQGCKSQWLCDKHNCPQRDNLTRTTKRQNTHKTHRKQGPFPAQVNSTIDTRKKSRLRDRTDRAWFSRLVQHPARKWSGSILSALKPTHGSHNGTIDHVSTEQCYTNVLSFKPSPLTESVSLQHCLFTPSVHFTNTDLRYVLVK